MKKKLTRFVCMAYDKTNLDLRLDVLDGVRRLHLEGDGLAGQGLDEDLHDCSAEGKTTK